MQSFSLRHKNLDILCIFAMLCLMLTVDISNALRAAKPSQVKARPAGMVWIPTGAFLMGSASRLARPNEQPVFKARVTGFWMDETDVTNAQFAAFVRATGYVTTAEKKPEWESLRVQLPPGTAKPDDALLVAGAMVFTGTSKPVPLDDWTQWWAYIPGANWRHPDGPSSNIDGKDNYPVVQVSWADAQAYAKWAGKRLATEVEWEYAARGGIAQADYVWGNEKNPQGKTMANIFGDQGHFPVVDAAYKTRIGTQAVKSYPANGYGLFDMTGNVWQWTADNYRADRFAQLSKSDQIENPPGPNDSFDPETSSSDAPSNAPKRVIRGGSFLCDENYCQSFRPSARRGADPDSPMSHIGFRLVLSEKS
jgi:formylglycine-generating enzyme required for sulfatase activity